MSQAFPVPRVLAELTVERLAIAWWETREHPYQPRPFSACASADFAYELLQFLRVNANVESSYLSEDLFARLVGWSR